MHFGITYEGDFGQMIYTTLFQEGHKLVRNFRQSFMQRMLVLSTWIVCGYFP